jgi:hypothetical protein
MWLGILESFDSYAATNFFCIGVGILLLLIHSFSGPEDYT